ncbi:MAG: BlaI/MecI/CopY family transcriptional regulator [Deltaproteobacteria bacterium]|nr:BlaI/MecI/CopY family transcriptional regulator [Deltaproteobacteria bacterium]
MDVVKVTRPLQRLGDLEHAVLEHVWRTGEADVTATHKTVGLRRGISANTVGSALERLYRKGLLTRRKVSHAYRYAPTLDRDAFVARRAVDAAGGVRALANAGVLAAFVDLVGDTDEAALVRLERLLVQKRARGKA